MRSREYLEQLKQTLQERLDQTTDPQMRSFYQETLESVQSELDQLAAEEQQGYEDPKVREYRLLHQGAPPRETKRSHIVFAEDEPREASATELCVKGALPSRARSTRGRRVSMAEIVTCGVGQLRWCRLVRLLDP
jgi:hypothetical protein